MATLKDELQQNPGTFSGSPTLISSLLVRDTIDQAVSFRSAASFSVPDSPALSLPIVVGGVAFEFTFRVPSLPGAEGTIIEKAGSYGVYLRADGKLRFHLVNGGSSVDLITTGAVTAGQKVHVVCVYNGGYTGATQIGVTTQGASRFSIPADQRQGVYTNAQNLIVSQYTILEKGRIDDIKLGLIRTADATSPEWLAAVLYADNAGVPGALLFQGDPQEIQPTETFAWTPWPVSGIILAQNTPVWLGVIAGSGYAEYGPISLAYDTTGGVGYKSTSHAISDTGSQLVTGSAPDPFGTVGATVANDKLSMYADYTELARTGDEGHVLVYLNGQEDSRAAYTAGIADSANALTGPTIDIDLDDLSIWNTKLDAVQVAKHYAAR